MTDGLHCAISTAPLSVEAALRFVSAPGNGAVTSFIGQVRDLNQGRAVRGVSYDVYDALALRGFEQLAAEARERWGGGLCLWLEHFKGRLEVGGVSIVIAVGSPHRDEGFQACRYLIEEIKHRSPIWKQEHYHDGDSAWVQGHALCRH